MEVYVIGDSISIHYGAYLENHLKDFMHYRRKEGINEAMKHLDIPDGANCGDSSMVLSYLKVLKAAGELTSDFVMVNCGLHDIKTSKETGKIQIPLEQYRSNLSSIINIFSDLDGVNLLWVSTTPCDEKVHNHPRIAFHRYANDCLAYNAVANDLMSKRGIPILDLHAFTVSLGHDLYCDHVHFHDHVRQKQAAFLAGALSMLAPAVYHR